LAGEAFQLVIDGVAFPVATGWIVGKLDMGKLRPSSGANFLFVRYPT